MRRRTGIPAKIFSQLRQERNVFDWDRFQHQLDFYGVRPLALWDDDYQHGDIVVLRKDTFLEEPIVKRVIATEGQTVDIDFVSGAVYVDGELLEEDYINEPTYVEEGTEFPLTVPEGSIFVMGDNRNHSSDSRSSDLGTVDTRYVIGKAVFLLFPGADEATGQRDFGRIGPLRGSTEHGDSFLRRIDWAPPARGGVR